MSAPIRHLSISQRPVFLVNSRLSLFTAATSLWLPFSRSYGVILQSSLTMVLPFVLGFSPRPPASVCGTGTYTIASNFSRQCEFVNFVHSDSSSAPSLTRRVLHYVLASCFEHTYPSACFHYPSVSLPHLNVIWEYRNINQFSIVYDYRPRLRSRLTLGG